MKLLLIVPCALMAALLGHRPVAARNVEMDVSSCSRMFQILTAMKGGATEARVSAMLDSVLQTKAYQTMFLHYNRSWRPNHLPVSVFKRMILSLRFNGAYRAGENQRADQMLVFWRKFYDDPDLYRRNLEQLAGTDLGRLVNDGVRYAQSWLPPGWQIPDFYVPIHPDGGSRAFTIGNAQGYDFFQLPRDSSGTILWRDLVVTISHESHHLGQMGRMPGPMSAADSVAYQFVTMFVGEGTATKFIDDVPGGCVPVVDSSRQDPRFGDSEVGKWWRKYTEEGPELFARMTAAFDSAYAGRLSQEDLRLEMGQYWLQGYVSPVYYIGADLFGAVYHGYGKEGAFAAMRDPRQLFRLYDEALKRRPELLGDCYVIPDSTVRHALAIGAGAK